MPRAKKLCLVDQNWARPIVLMVAMGMASTSALGETADWSFANHPHPRYETMTTMEKARMDAVVVDDDDPFRCNKIIDTGYAIYRHRYPAFEKATASLGATSQLKLWRIHVFRASHPGTHLCLLSDLRKKIRNLMDVSRIDSQFYFCGHWSRPPQTSAEENFVRLLEEMVTYAKTGDFFAIQALMGHSGKWAHVQLNPDIAYYFYKIARPLDFFEDWEGLINSHLSRQQDYFSTKRKAVIERHAEARDYQAVVASSPACSRKLSAFP